MNLDMWFRDDVSNILDGIVTAVRHSGATQSDDWQRGFVAAIAAVQASFGIRTAGNSTRQPALQDWRLEDMRGMYK